MSASPLVLVHGGAGTVSDELHEAVVEGARAAAMMGWGALERGEDAEAAAVAAVRVMEDAEAFNAGRGSCMTAEGQFEADASIMRSRDGASGAIAAVKNVSDAVLVAQAVMREGTHRMLAGEGVVRFAEEQGVGTFGRDGVWTDKAQQRFDAVNAGELDKDNRADTVGAVVLDAQGHLCVASSTGGVLMKRPGRVGDTPLIGPGFYADATLGAACATGVGEAIMAHMMAYALLVRPRDPSRSWQEDARDLCAQVFRASGSAVGLIGIRPDGEVAVAHGSDHMSWALARASGVVGGLTAPEDVP